MRSRTKRKTRDKPHALVVGGTRGAGRVAVRQLAAEGYRVSVLARGAPARGQLASKAVQYWQADITDTGALRTALSLVHTRRGGLACIVFFQRFRGASDGWQGEIETSLTATRSVVEMLVNEFALRDASIVFVSSVNASLISRQLPLAYHIAKAGLNQMVRYYAVALGPRGIRANSVSPGSFLKDESRAAVLADRKLVNLYERIIPLGRICTADEVVAAVSFLAGRLSSFITGQDLIVDGGLSLVYQETLARELVLDGKPALPASP